MSLVLPWFHIQTEMCPSIFVKDVVQSWLHFSTHGMNMHGVNMHEVNMHGVNMGRDLVLSGSN